jgi:hypothetical protein
MLKLEGYEVNAALNCNTKFNFEDKFTAIFMLNVWRS